MSAHTTTTGGVLVTFNGGCRSPIVAPIARLATGQAAVTTKEHFMGATERRFDRIGKVRLYYMRHRDGVARPATFRSTDELYDTTAEFVDDLDTYARAAGYGSISRIYSAGFYVNKRGEHGRGRAFDLDRVLWTSGRACSPIYGVHEHPKPWARRRYYGVEAVCRQHFGTVLDGNYNAAHGDHIHADLGTRVGLTRSAKSEIKFLQAVCNEFGGQRLVVDGIFGPKSARGLRITLAKAGLKGAKPFDRVQDYLRFLDITAWYGLRGLAFNG